MRSTHFHCCSKTNWGWPYWLASQWAQYLWRGILNYLSPHALIFLRYPIFWFAKWLLLHLKMCNLNMLASLERPQIKKSSCSFNMVKLTVNELWFLTGMLDAEMRINDNIDPNWANVICKWSVTITTCSFPYIRKSKELDYVESVSGAAIEVMVVLRSPIHAN